MTQSETDRWGLPEAIGRKVGYVVTAAVDLVGLWVAGHLLDWGWPAFLTDEFEDLLPWISISLAATAVLNVLWVVADPDWFRHLGQLALDVITVIVSVRTWQIFPFDFSGYAWVWEAGTRALIVVATVGSAIAAVVELVALVRLWAEADVGDSTCAHRGRHGPAHA